MTSSEDHFETAVGGIAGSWPRPPETWSYSSLSEAEECPRRWTLSHATYPGIWEHHGYPPRPNLPALVGDVVHRVLELILRGLNANGCESLADPHAVDVLKELGGYSKMIERAIGERLDRLVDNPRMTEEILGLQTSLRARVPEMRGRVQAVLARSRIKAIPRSTLADASGGSKRTPLSEGSHPEVDLRAPDLRLVGRVDLVTLEAGSCEIIDYKSGAPGEHHAEQLAMYALLWSRDVELNPRQLPVSQLVVSYTTHDIFLELPTKMDLDALADRIVGRVAAVEGDIALRPPPARPSPEICGLCTVRHLCDDYWAGFASDGMRELSTRTGDLMDCEMNVVSQNGPRSWQATIGRASVPVLVRTITETPGFGRGDRVRLLGVLFARDDDSGQIVTTITEASELFVLTSR